MTVIAPLSRPALPPGFTSGDSFAINPTPPPATIPISFISDLGAPAGGVVSRSPVLTGIPFGVRFSGADVELPLTPLPAPAGARVSMSPGAYPTDYQTAGNSLIVEAEIYTAALAVYALELATFVGSASWATYVAAGETEAAFLVLIATSDYQTWLAAFTLAEVAYGAYVLAYNPAQSALNWWATWANAVNFFNSNPRASNPYSSANRI